METGPCICGSGKRAPACCFNGFEWHKTPAALNLKSLPAKSVVEKCYMSSLGSCEGKISGEHLISESIMHLLRAGGGFSISGLPWLRPGEERVMTASALTANCLCQLHNSALSPIDTAALRFFSALKSCMDQEANSLRFIASGHDIERWLLKTIKALAVSRNLARQQERLSGEFASGIDFIEMIDEPRKWPQGAGLHFMMRTGEETINHPRFQLAPYANNRNQIYGLGVSILGLYFALMLEAPDPTMLPHLDGATFRAGEIKVNFRNSNSSIKLSWEDGAPHDAFLSLGHLSNVDPKSLARSPPHFALGGKR